MTISKIIEKLEEIASFENLNLECKRTLLHAIHQIRFIKEENERLKAVSNAELESMHNLGDDYENALEEISRLKAKIEKLENGYRLHLNYISVLEKEQRNVRIARCEAVKGFALLVNRRMFRGAKHAYERSYIENLAAEMVGAE